MLECIKKKIQRKTEQSIMLSKSRERICNFDYYEEDIYLGKNGVLISTNANYKLSFSYSVRDGVFFQFKRHNPYKIIFDFNDGAYILNDNSEYDYSKLLSLLNLLKSNKQEYEDNKIYSELKEVASLFINEYFGNSIDSV